MSSLAEQLERYIEARVRERHERVERACEESLAGGEHGVLVTDGPGDLVVEVSPDVPYGEIHYRAALGWTHDVRIRD